MNALCLYIFRLRFYLLVNSMIVKPYLFVSLPYLNNPFEYIPSAVSSFYRILICWPLLHVYLCIHFAVVLYYYLPWFSQIQSYTKYNFDLCAEYYWSLCFSSTKWYVCICIYIYIYIYAYVISLSLYMYVLCILFCSSFSCVINLHLIIWSSLLNFVFYANYGFLVCFYAHMFTVELHPDSPFNVISLNKSEFSYDSAKHRLRLLKIEDMKDLDELPDRNQHMLNLSSVLDFDDIQTIMAAG